MEIEQIDWRSPLAAFAPLAGRAHAHLLHAGEEAAAPGWSILVACPSRVLTARAGRARLDGAAIAVPPFEALRKLHVEQRRKWDGARCKGANLDGRFMSGLVGFVGYEMGAAFEPSAAGPPSPFALPDMIFAAYDAAVLFDRTQRRAFLCARNQAAAEALKEALAEKCTSAPVAAPRFNALRSNFDAARYQAAVSDTIERIREGAIFQANLSQQLTLSTDNPVCAFNLFCRLMRESDAVHGALLQYKDGSIVSNSPERFFRIEPAAGAWRIVAEPIKGTCARGNDAESDAALAAALAADPKERAENIMIADLTRNDLSRICANGSVREEAICQVLSLSRVHHLVSRLSGVLDDGVDFIDALAALFPCGSVTGAPKVEAMKTIAEIEGVGRGPYCGAIGYIDDAGAADFSVAIRIMVIEKAGAGSRVVCPVGGGVTLRSGPFAEYEETRLKAQSILRALGAEEESRP
ncbi:MAG: anthranilate synthase component I family protein [Parvularculaceae bacterium]